MVVTTACESCQGQIRRRSRRSSQGFGGAAAQVDTGHMYQACGVESARGDRTRGESRWPTAGDVSLRQWHCTCGSTDIVTWYRGLQSLLDNSQVVIAQGGIQKITDMIQVNPRVTALRCDNQNPSKSTHCSWMRFPSASVSFCSHCAFTCGTLCFCFSLSLAIA